MTIYIKDPLSNTQVSENIIGQCSDGTYPLVGMEIKKTLQTFLNLSVKANSVSARSKGIYIGGCKSHTIRNKNLLMLMLLTTISTCMMSAMQKQGYLPKTVWQYACKMSFGRTNDCFTSRT